jgi:hypothetical protein
LLFARVLLTAISLLRLCPGSRLFSDVLFRAWDITSAAVLCRNIVETYLTMFYIRVDRVSEEESGLRLTYWDYHCESESLEMCQNGLPESKALPLLKEKVAALRAKLESLPAFRRLDPQMKRALLRVRHPRVARPDELCKNAGVNQQHFRFDHQYLSNHVHATAFSMNQMDSLTRENPETPQVFEHIVRIAVCYTAIAIRDYLRIWPAFRAAVSNDVLKLIDDACEVLSFDPAKPPPEEATGGQCQIKPRSTPPARSAECDRACPSQS